MDRMASRGRVLRESDPRDALTTDAPAGGPDEGMYPEAGTGKVGKRAEGCRNKNHHPRDQADSVRAITVCGDTGETGKIAGSIRPAPVITGHS